MTAVTGEISRRRARLPRRRASGRAPSASPRMLGAVRDRAVPTSRRAVILADVSDRLIRMTEFGLQHARADESGWWRCVEREMQALVDAHLPTGARDVQMRLDPTQLQVVLEYDLH